MNAHIRVNPECSALSPRSTVLVLLAAALAVAGCKKGEAPATAADAGGGNTKTEVTVLVTGDENGWLLPSNDAEGKEHGGAAKLAGKWVTEENHCAPEAGRSRADACNLKDAATIALSTGDHFNGPAISSFFFGEPTAEVMARIGYDASGVGNHEMDFGVDQFIKNQKTGGFPYLAANVTVAPDGPQGVEFKPFVVLERKGVKVAVVGLANVEAPKTVMSGKLHGLSFAAYEEALTRTMPEVAKAGADAIVVLVDECPKDLEPIFGNHADWKVNLVVGGHCREAYEAKQGDTRLFSPGRRFEKYVRAKLTVDLSKPAGQRLADLDAKVVEVGDAQAFSPLATVINGWKEKLDQALGEEIGFTKSGLKQDSPELGRWVTTAWRDTFSTDVALVNKNGLRQDLPPGKITRASVYSVMPFENSVMVVKLPGEALIKALGNGQAVFTGATKAGSGFKDAKGKAIDPKATYTVATIEYLYFGGDGFEMEQHDPLPTETGMVWQTPVVEWTKKQGTTEAKPLERLLKK